MTSDDALLSPLPPPLQSVPWPSLCRYFSRHLQLLPAAYSSQDCNRVTIAHFALCGLDVALRHMGESLPEELCGRVVRWLYAQQVEGGFRGAPAAGGPGSGGWECAHLASTYSALVTLSTAGEQLLQGVLRAGILRHIRRLQRDDGSVACMDSEAAEADLRFTYCAVACSHLLGDTALSHLDVDRLQQFVLSCQSYEGGFGLTPHGEAHGGATYCALAALHIAGRLQSALSQRHGGGTSRRQRLIGWCVARQGGGYTGRANKPVDSCYSFWLGASMQLLHATALTSPHSNLAALLACFDQQHGGFGKEAELLPDIMHSFLGAQGAAIIQHADSQQQPQQQQRQSDESSLPLPRSQFDVSLGVRREQSGSMQ